jgi:hypothetical protein
MSEWMNDALHPEGSAARRKLERLRQDADRSAAGSPAHVVYGREARLAYLHPQQFEIDAAAEEPAVGHPDGGSVPAPKAAPIAAPAHRRR